MKAKYSAILPAFTVPTADLCEHGSFNIYVNGQLVESVKARAANAAQALAFWQRTGIGIVTWTSSCCSVPNCRERRADT